MHLCMYEVLFGQVQPIHDPDASFSIPTRNTALLILLASTFMVCLLGLTVMRGDAGRLVLNPLQRMLRIVVRCK